MDGTVTTMTRLTGQLATRLASPLPRGPARLEAAPYEGYCPPEVRQEAFSAVLEDVELGAYDLRIVPWLTQWDDTTCRTIASFLWRCRLAGGAEARRRPRCQR